jgi:hypothetical protein
MTDSYSAGETIPVSVDFGDHPDAPGRVFDAVAEAATLTLQHFAEHDQRHEFSTDGAVEMQGQTIAVDIPPGTLETSGRWVYQGRVTLEDGRTLVWPRDPVRITIMESIV